MKLIQTIFFLLGITVALSAQPACVATNGCRSAEILYDPAAMENTVLFADYRAVFFGEGHVRDFEPAFKEALVKHLNKGFGFRHIVMEIGYCAAYCYNQYLQSGDSSWLINYKLVYSRNNYLAFWQNLYRYNRTLPDSLKLVIHGVDFERTEIFKLLDQLRDPGIPVLPALRETFVRIRSLAADTSLYALGKRFADELGRVRTSLLAHRQELRSLYGDQYDLVIRALTNTAPPTERVNPRNKAWERNFRSLAEQEDIDRFIAFFGKSHTTYANPFSPAHHWSSIAGLSGRVLNITTLYTNFKNYWDGEEEGALGPLKKEKPLIGDYLPDGCRASLVPAAQINNDKIRKRADFILFARDIAE